LSTDSLRLHLCKNTDFMRLAATYLKPHLHYRANQLILFHIYPGTSAENIDIRIEGDADHLPPARLVTEFLGQPGNV
jgi:hypothetical protein